MAAGRAGARKLHAYSSGYNYRPREPPTAKLKVNGLEIKSFFATFRSVWELPTPSPTPSVTPSRSPSKAPVVVQLTVNATATPANRTESTLPANISDPSGVTHCVFPIEVDAWVIVHCVLYAAVVTASNAPVHSAVESATHMPEALQKRREMGHVVNPATAVLTDDKRPPLFAAMWIVLIGSVAVGLLACGRMAYFRRMCVKRGGGDVESGHGKGK